MKPSPLLLKWVSYPEASYEARGTSEATNGPCSVTTAAAVTWSLDGEHTASVELTSTDTETAPYRFAVKVIAVFTFDLGLAMQTYGAKSGLALPPIIAVNVIRILYAGAREQIAMMTARAPLGSVVLESVLFEPKDIEIDSYQSPTEILAAIFGLEEAELAKVAKRISDAPQPAEVSAEATPSSAAKLSKRNRQTK